MAYVGKYFPMSSKNPSPLDQFLCLDLYTASRVVIQAYGPLLEKLNLTYPQYLVMSALWVEDELKVKDISEHLHLDSGTLSPLLKRLEAAGLVSRTRGKEDEREVRIALTAAGKTLQQKSGEVTAGIGCILGMSPTEAQKLQKILRGLVGRIEADKPV
jgi:MarR family transcriptional regulator, organic hydroperoxide resistance regulator